MTAISIISLMIIPVFQYTHDADGDVIDVKSIENIVIMATYFINLMYVLELGWKIFAFGLGKAWQTSSLANKMEFFMTPIVWSLFPVWLTRLEAPLARHYLVNALSLSVLVRATRLT